MSNDSMRARGGRPVLAIEIGARSLKMLVGSVSRSGIRLDRAHVSRYERVSDDLATEIAATLKSWKARKLPVLACLPRSLATVHALDLPSVNPAELADMVDFQALRQTPYSKEEILYDYRLAGSQRPGYTRVLLVIAQRSALRQRFHIFEEAGLEPERMTLGTEGLLAASELAVPKKTGEPVAWLDVDADSAEFVVVANRQPSHSRSIRLGADQLATNAEETRPKLLEEILRSLERHRAESPDHAPRSLTVTGARLPGLGEWLADGLGLPCETRDLLSNAKTWPRDLAKDEPALHACSLTALLGMAAAPERLDINLIPDTVRSRRELLRHSRQLGTFGLWLTTALAALSLFATLRFFLLKAQRDALREEFLASEPARQRMEHKQTVAGKARAYADPRNSAARILADIHPLIPPDVFLESIEYDAERNRVVLAGSGNTIQDARTLVRNLEAADSFRNVSEEGSTAKDSRTGRFRFRIACPLAEPER